MCPTVLKAHLTLPRGWRYRHPKAAGRFGARIISPLRATRSVSTTSFNATWYGGETWSSYSGRIGPAFIVLRSSLVYELDTPVAVGVILYAVMASFRTPRRLYTARDVLPVVMIHLLRRPNRTPRV